jgi:hypothetical protein
VHFGLSGVVFCLDLHPFFCFLSCSLSLAGYFSFIYLFIYYITDISLSGRGCYLLAPLIFFLAMQNFAPGKKGLIVLSYLTTHASSWYLNNGTHSIITYGSSIVGMLIHVM